MRGNCVGACISYTLILLLLIVYIPVLYILGNMHNALFFLVDAVLRLCLFVSPFFCFVTAVFVGSFIESIRPTAESYGIAKIVPPAGWKPPPTPMSLHARKRAPTKKQALHSLMNVRRGVVQPFLFFLCVVVGRACVGVR